MTQIEALSRRISRAEDELAALRARAAITTLIAASAIVTTLTGGWWAPLIAAGDAPPMTVRAPFTVADANGKPIVSIIDGENQTVTMTTADGRKQTQTKPLSNRGLLVFNAAGDAVARAAVSGGNGYVVARQAGVGTSLGGPGAGLVANKDGLELAIVGTDDRAVRLSSDYSGLQFEGAGEAILTQLNRGGLTIASESGSNVVEAGILPDGRGVVRVGPRFGGPLGPGQLGFPYQIVGRK